MSATEALAGASDQLCDRCPTGWRLAADTVCAECRTEIDTAFGALAGADA